MSNRGGHALKARSQVWRRSCATSEEKARKATHRCWSLERRARLRAPSRKGLGLRRCCVRPGDRMAAILQSREASALGSVHYDRVESPVIEPPFASPTTRAGHRPMFYANVLTALRDLVQGIAAVRIWSMLGWQEVRQRYRRSTLGPFGWTTAPAVLLAALGRRSVGCCT